MNPSQTSPPNHKQFNPSRIFVAGLVIVLCCAAVFFLLPSARESRVEKAEKKLNLLVQTKKGRFASQSDVVEIGSTNNYLVRRIKDAPSLYLFIPSLNNNIAVLGRLQKIRPGLDGYTVFLIPRPDHDSPTTEKAVGMCLLKEGKWTVDDLIKAAPDMLSSKANIDANWSDLSAEDKGKITDQLKANEKVQKRYGDMTTLVVDGKRAILMENWFEVGNLLDCLRELHQAEAKVMNP